MRVKVNFRSTENRLPVAFHEDNSPLLVKFDGAVISGSQFWFGTLDEYNALPYINPNICYCIQEGE